MSSRVTDDRGARYRLDHTPGSDLAWPNMIRLNPAPPGEHPLARRRPAVPAGGPRRTWAPAARERQAAPPCGGSPGVVPRGRCRPGQRLRHRPQPGRAPAGHAGRAAAHRGRQSSRAAACWPLLPTRPRQVVAGGFGTIIAGARGRPTCCRRSARARPARHAVRQPGPDRARHRRAANARPAGTLAEPAGALPAQEAGADPDARGLRRRPGRQPAGAGRHPGDPARPAAHPGWFRPMHVLAQGPDAGAQPRGRSTST